MTKKSRILYTLEFLYENTDEQNPASSKEIMQYLTDQGLEVHRTTLKSDIELIIEIGIDVVTVRSSPNRYFIGNRNLEPVEIKMLADAICSSKFITAKKSKKLIGKISLFTSKHIANDIKEDFCVNKVFKTMNEKIYYTADIINQAIKEKRFICFKYFEYTPEKQLMHKYDGYVYEVCPYTTFWSDDHYYVIGYSKKHEKITVFRIDRMDETALYSEEYLPPPNDFDPSVYANEIFEMYDGKPCEVQLKCSKRLMNVIVDKFGESVCTEIIDDKTFKATVMIRESPRFYAWVFGFLGEISILLPLEIKNKYIQSAKNII